MAALLSLSTPALFASVVAVYLASFYIKWIFNYIKARRIGLPIIMLPMDQNHFVWMISSVPSRPLLKKYLPENLYNRVTLMIYGWEHHQKIAPFTHALGGSTKTEKMKGQGKSIIFSGCGRLELWTCDAGVAKDILGRPNDFQQLDLTEVFVGQFGPNVLSTNGEVWAKHRRVVASAVTEKVSKVVWAESVKQTRGLLNEVVLEKGTGTSGETRKIFDMMKKITVHVLSGAGMGIVQGWKTNDDNDETEKPIEAYQKTNGGFRLKYIEAVKMINESMTGPLVLPTKMLQNWPSFMPRYEYMRKLGYAKEEFPLHTQEMLAKEKEISEEERRKGNTEPRNNFMSTLISASDDGDEEAQKGAVMKRKGPALTDAEIISNLYIFTAAGFDTTANTLAFALTMLARHPKWQDWLFEEIDALLEPRPGEHQEGDRLLEYTAVFPRCTRVLAFMYETLRHFTPLSHIVKMTKVPTTVTTNAGEKVVLPAPMNVYIHTVALHLDPSVWRNLNLPTTNKGAINKMTSEDAPGRHAAKACGLNEADLEDEWMFRPTRWINKTTAADQTETLFQPQRNTFLPWSMGPRVCPGQRMAQVEFTAIFLTLFRNHRIEAVPMPNETEADVNRRLDQLMENSMSVLTLEMPVYDIKSEKDTKGLNVRLVKRK